jgi:hypothetical protein
MSQKTGTKQERKRKDDKKSNKKRRKGNKSLSQKSEKGREKLDKELIKENELKIKVQTHKLLASTLSYLMIIS